MQDTNQAISDACYAKGRYRYAEDGVTVLNELGLPAKKGDIVLRADNGWPLQRMGHTGPMNIDRNTGKVVA